MNVFSTIDQIEKEKEGFSEMLRNMHQREKMVQLEAFAVFHNILKKKIFFEILEGVLIDETFKII